MKRIALILIALSALTSCGAVEPANEVSLPVEAGQITATQNDEISSTDTTTAGGVCSFGAPDAYYSKEDFMRSETWKKLSGSDYPPMFPELDESRYELTQILSSNTYYQCVFLDNETKKTVSIGIDCSGSTEDLNKYAERNRKCSPEIVTAANRDGNYELCLLKTAYYTVENYGIVYLPGEGYEVSIYAHNSTKEEILAYFAELSIR